MTDKEVNESVYNAQFMGVIGKLKRDFTSDNKDYREGFSDALREVEKAYLGINEPALHKLKTHYDYLLEEKELRHQCELKEQVEKINQIRLELNSYKIKWSVVELIFRGKGE